jgi:hypothetical protein
MLRHAEATGSDLTVRWARPREWRKHALANDPHWVEEEVTVVLGHHLVDQLSWNQPLEDEARRLIDAALALKWEAPFLMG